MDDYTNQHKGQGNFTNHHTNKPQDFWMSVRIGSPDECWEWQNALDADGYGVWSIQGQQVKTHRYAYELSKGKIPDSLHVCHSCDNRRCCNPSHLWVGTNDDNHADKRRKGREVPPPTFYGSSHPQSKLTEQDVLEIRALYAEGNDTYKTLAQKFNVSSGLIGHVVTRRNWKHI
jgi:hypothetical protein